MRGIATWGSDAIRGERLILAVKAAVAASVAWLLAPYVPFADSEYSYYAPLGVLVSMYPTVAGSARAGAQSLLGLGIGIALGLGGLGLVLTGAPGLVAIALVIGVGIIIGGVTALGAGRDLVAVAALFVLLIGGLDADQFSLSYLLTMAFGVVVGVLTNLLIVPPLYLRRASERLSSLRDAARDVLRDVADALDDKAVDSERIAGSARELADLLAGAADEVNVAEESSRGNPRSRGRAGDRRLNALRLRALERTTRATIELAEILAQAGAGSRGSDLETWRALSDAVRASADLVAAPPNDASAQSRLQAAGDALDTAVAELGRLTSPAGAPAYSRAFAYAAAVCVRRIVDASREFVTAPAD
ncbi:MAG TPA: FUSC family protein [Microbacterium sp.]|nr:FUSC family protein [Microbacterium sp.]